MNPTNVSQPSSSSTAPSERPQNDPSTGAGSTRESLKETARETAQRVKATAASAAAQVKEGANQVVDQEKKEVADRIGGYGAAMEETAQSLEEKDPNIAWFSRRVADRIQSVADYVRNRDLSGFRTDAEGWARQHPAAFFSGLFITGLVVGNILKATRAPREQMSGASLPLEATQNLASEGPPASQLADEIATPQFQQP